MLRSELKQKLAEKFPDLTVVDVEEAVDIILNKISATLANGDRVEVRQFGSFELHYRPQRIGRNPKTGTLVQIAATYRPHFKAGKELRERVSLDVKR